MIIDLLIINRETIPDMPERPQGQRTEPAPTATRFDTIFQGFQFTTGNVAFHFGSFGLLPLAIQMAFQSGVFNPNVPPNEDPMASTRAFVSRMFFMIGLMSLVFIILY